MIRCPFCDHKNPAGTTRCGECQAELFASPEDAADSADSEPLSLDGRVIALLCDGRKIEAIKLYRDLTGAGLKEAKDAVEALERDGSLPTRDASSGDDPDVLELLRAGQKIRAIKLYRDKTGAGLAESKNAIETLARKNGIPAGQSGCSSAVFCLLAIALILGYLMA